MDFEALLNPYVFLTLIMGVLVFYSQWFDTPVSLLKPLPGPPGWSILGNLPQLIAAGFDINDFHKRLRKSYNAVFGYRVFGRSVVVINDPVVVKKVFDHKDVCGRPRGEIHEAIAQAPNVGILTSYGNTWKEHDELLTRFFNDAFTKDKMESVCTMAAKKLVVTLSGYSGQPFDAHRHSILALTCICCEMMFGEAFDHEDERVKELSDIITERQRTEPSAVWRLMPSSLKKFPFTGMRRRRQLDNRFVDAVTRLIKDHTEQRAGTTPCFVDRYQHEMEVHLEKLKEGMATSLTKDNLLWSCVDFLTVMVDDASRLLSQALEQISIHPEMQTSLLEDINQHDGAPTATRPAYLAAVLQEARRIGCHDPWAMSLVAQADMSVGDLEIPQGSVIVANELYMGLECPAKFEPGRFIEQDGSFIGGKEPISVSTGKHACLVDAVTSTACSIIFYHVCRRFNLSLPVQTPQPYKSNGTKATSTVAKQH